MNDIEWGCRKSVSLFLNWLTFTHNVSIHTKKQTTTFYLAQFKWLVQTGFSFIIFSTEPSSSSSSRHGTSSSTSGLLSVPHVLTTCIQCSLPTGVKGAERLSGFLFHIFSKKIYLDFFGKRKTRNLTIIRVLCGGWRGGRGRDCGGGGGPPLIPAPQQFNCQATAFINSQCGSKHCLKWPGVKLLSVFWWRFLWRSILPNVLFYNAFTRHYKTCHKCL